LLRFLEKLFLGCGLEPIFSFGEVANELVVAGAGSRFGAGDEEGLAEIGGVGGGYVGAAVAYEEGLGEVEGEVGGGAEEHAGGGFAVFAFALIFADAVDGVVRAEVDGVEGDLLFEEFGADVVHDEVELGFGVEAAGYAGLVGDDDEFVGEGLGEAAEGEDAFDEEDFGGVVEVADFLVDYAVAV
jgi:hypothetical protein